MKINDSPLYRAVKQQILESLAVGEWISSQTLPSQAELCERYSVSVGTLRKAMDELVQERILVRKAGKGTFIAPHDEERLLFHFYNVIGRDGTRKLPVSEVLTARRVKAAKDVARQLHLQPGDLIHRFENLRRIDGDPTLHDTLYVRADKLPGLTPEVFKSRRGTIYDLYLSRFGINIVRTVETIGATLCPSNIAAHLRLNKKVPVLEITRVALTYNDEPIEFRISYMSSERHVYLSDQGKTHR